MSVWRGTKVLTKEDGRRLMKAINGVKVTLACPICKYCGWYKDEEAKKYVCVKCGTEREIQ